MPKFHIDVCTAFEKVPDRVGRELASGREATKLAIRYARLLLAKMSYRHIDFKVLVVRDDNGRLVANLPFRSAAIKLPVRPPITPELGAAPAPASTPRHQEHRSSS